VWRFHFNAHFSAFACPYTLLTMPLNVDDTDTIPEDEFRRLERLRRVKGSLWLAGNHRKTIRALHRQIVLGREIVVADDISLPLITQSGKAIYVKPIPDGLMKLSMAQANNALPWLLTLVTPKGASTEKRLIIYGFVTTYLSMIKSITDFRLAKEKHLLPECLFDVGDDRKAFDTWHASRETLEVQIGACEKRLCNESLV
jgi:hypothetical protein